MFFKYFSKQILFSRIFQDNPVYSSTFQACMNPVTQSQSDDIIHSVQITVSEIIEHSLSDFKNTLVFL